MKKIIFFCIYLIVQLAVVILSPMGIFLRNFLYLAIVSSLAMITAVFLIVFLVNSTKPKN